MNWKLLKKDISDLKKKLGFSKEKEGFMQRDKPQNNFFYKEGDLVAQKLTREIYLVEKNLSPNFLEPRKRCLLKNKEGKQITLYEHELVNYTELPLKKKIGFENL